MSPKTEGMNSEPSNGAAVLEVEGSSPHNGYTLRWINFTKTVQIKETSGGMLKNSSTMALPATEGPTNNNNGTDTSDKRGALANNKAKSMSAISSRFFNVGKTKTILSGISGSAHSGEVLALMGPSGSGKTTLLNALSGRTSFDNGQLSVNNTIVTGDGWKRFQSKVAYVKQSDIFFDHLTVRDQLLYTAYLRLPDTYKTIEEKNQEVHNILTMLRLHKVADSPISMISGGERKRVNIGTELLTDPACVLLDEPTSGLDSTSAVALMKLLQQLAISKSKTIITSIHQPSSGVFASFDKLMLLAEGRMVYFGTPAGSLAYLETQNMACPNGYNAADHWMDLLVQDSAIEEKEHTTTNNQEGETEEIVTKSSRQLLIEAWDSDAVAEQLETELNDNDDAKSHLSFLTNDHDKSSTAVSKYNTSWITQYRVLTHRALKNSRSAIFTPLNLVKSGLLGVIAGLFYFQLDYTENSVFDRSAYFFFTMTYWVFDGMFNALMAFPAEREVILKERASASYHLSAYFMAKTTSEMPTRLALPLLYMILSFWLAGISSKFLLFLYSTLFTLLSVMAGEAIGLMVGASVYDMEKALTVMTVVAITMMLLGGFFVENMPSFLLWGKYVSPFKYSFDGSRQLVFDRPVPCDGSGKLEELCGGRSEGFVSEQDVLDFLGIDHGVGFNLCLLLFIGLLPRYIGYLALRSHKGGDR